MTTPSSIVSRIAITLDGAQVQRPVLQKLVQVVVDQHAHIPDMFSLRFRDPGLELLDNGPFDLTKEVEIKAARQDGEQVSLMKGEITALEPDFNEGMILDFVVRGYDRSHRLYRETRSQAYLNVKDSDLAETIARKAGLQAEVETTRTVYDHIFQHNQSDLAFLLQRAWRIGFECYVADGKLYFRTPPAGDATVELTWGRDLLSFQPRMTLAEQVDQVVVRGWDVANKSAIVGQAESGHLYPRIQESQDGAAWAANFGTGKRIFTGQPITTQAEADTLAAARLDEISGAFIQAEGVAFRRPDIRAGTKVSLSALGNRLSGTYLVTQATHMYTTEGLKTYFKVRGVRNGILSEQLSQSDMGIRWPGAVIAIVTNTDDPNNWGRVKVKFPWLSEDAESDWARVVGPGAGPEAGFFILPEVDDEVLVTFGQGDFSQPFVIGGLWNGRHDLPPEASGASSGEKPLVRTWHSRSGHKIAVHDNADNKIELATSGGHSVLLDDANRKVVITSSGGITLTLDDTSSKISFQGSSEVEINTNANFKLQAGGNLDLQASGQVTIRGAMVNIN